MKNITKQGINELLLAMELHKTISNKLIDKVIYETNQPEKEEIIKGNYSRIENTLIEHLSESWNYNVHGEHCEFTNKKTGQSLEVYLGNEESIEILDPYFFYVFLETTKELKYLSTFFKNPFNDMLKLFKELTEQNLMVNVNGINYKKSKNYDVGF